MTEEKCPFGGCIGESCKYFCDPCFLWMDEDSDEDYVVEFVDEGDSE